MRLDKTRTAQEQKVANLFRLLGFSLKTDYRPKGREFDVFAVKELLTIAVECKDYAEATAGRTNIEEFSEKLRDVGNTVGVFVANRFSPTERNLCNELGLAHWTTSDVESTTEMLRAKRLRFKSVHVSTEIWDLLAALKTYTIRWYEYIHDWVIQRELTESTLFEMNGLITIEHTSAGFSYSKTQAGEEFFGQLRRISSFLESDEVSEWDDRYRAASIIAKACSWDNLDAPSGPWDRMILASLSVHQGEDFRLSPFGQRLRTVTSKIASSCQDQPT